MLSSLKLANDRVIEEVGLYVFNIHNIVEKYKHCTRANPGRVASIVIRTSYSHETIELHILYMIQNYCCSNLMVL
jgi:hypothetical protein